MKQVVDAVVEAGLIDSSILDEMARWGIHVTSAPNAQIANDPKAVVEHIRQAIESNDQVRMDETELDLLTRYLDRKHKKTGRLTVKEGKKHHTHSVDFCVTHTGEYAIPWTEEDETPHVLANGETHLKWEADGVQHDVYFTEVREVFFGKKKAFAVCTALKEKVDEQ